MTHNQRWILPLAHTTNFGLTKTDKGEGEEADREAIPLAICDVLLAQALEGSDKADVIFEANGVRIASGHKGLLVARSPVFRKMFSIGMQEQRTGKVQIEASSSTFRVFLQFVYLGMAPFHTFFATVTFFVHLPQLLQQKRLL